jgi:hypothetical protein
MRGSINVPGGQSPATGGLSQISRCESTGGYGISDGVDGLKSAPGIAEHIKSKLIDFSLNPDAGQKTLPFTPKMV